jgi:hypothetical protein
VNVGIGFTSLTGGVVRQCTTETYGRQYKYLPMIIQGHKLNDAHIAELNNWDVFSLPSVSDCGDLPSEPGVYFLIVNADVLYIGQTWRLDRRWKNHTHKSHLERPNARIAFLIVAKELACVRNEIERLFIKRFKPVLNKSGRAGAVPTRCGEISIPG